MNGGRIERFKLTLRRFLMMISEKHRVAGDGEALSSDPFLANV